MKKQFTPGSQWLLGDQVVEVNGAGTSLARLNVLVLSSMLCKEVPIADLAPMPAAPGVDTGSIAKEKWDKAKARAMVLEPYLDAERLPDGALDELTHAMGVSRTQVQRLRARYAAGQRTSDLVDHARGRATGTRMLCEARESLIAEAIQQHFACAEPTSLRRLVERIRLAARERGLQPPTERTIRARVKRLSGEYVESRQKGRKAAKQRWEPRPGQLVRTEAMALVQIDHTLIDVILVDEDGRELGRAWLTLAIDVATRAIVGWYLAMHEPSAVSVAMCMAHMMRPKPENEDEPDLWPMYGRPQVILVDNGRDLRSLAFQRGCEQHGIELRWRPVGKAYYGAHIERLMGTIMGEVHTLPGTTFSRPHMKGDYDSQAKACLTLAQLRAWLIERICRGYHVRPHAGLNGKPPLLAWEDAHRDDGGAFVLPAIPMDADALHRDFFPSETRRVQRTGIQFKGSRYWAKELGSHVGPDEILRVHFNPQDLGVIWPRLPDGRMVEARPVAGRLITGAPYRTNAVTRERLDDTLTLGHRRADAIVADARKAKRSRPRTLAASAPIASPGIAALAPPDRDAITVEVDL